MRLSTEEGSSVTFYPSIKSVTNEQLRCAKTHAIPLNEVVRGDHRYNGKGICHNNKNGRHAAAVRQSRNGRDDWIRTSDLTHPKRARYQAAPRPVSLTYYRAKNKLSNGRLTYFGSRFVSCCSSSDNNSRNSAANCFSPCLSSAANGATLGVKLVARVKLTLSVADDSLIT